MARLPLLLLPFSLTRGGGGLPSTARSIHPPAPGAQRRAFSRGEHIANRPGSAGTWVKGPAHLFSLPHGGSD